MSKLLLITTPYEGEDASFVVECDSWGVSGAVLHHIDDRYLCTMYAPGEWCTAEEVLPEDIELGDSDDLPVLVDTDAQ